MSPSLDVQIWSLKWLRKRLTCLPFYYQSIKADLFAQYVEYIYLN